MAESSGSLYGLTTAHCSTTPVYRLSGSVSMISGSQEHLAYALKNCATSSTKITAPPTSTSSVARTYDSPDSISGGKEPTCWMRVWQLFWINWTDILYLFVLHTGEDGHVLFAQKSPGGLERGDPVSVCHQDVNQRQGIIFVHDTDDEFHQNPSSASDARHAIRVPAARVTLHL